MDFLYDSVLLFLKLRKKDNQSLFFPEGFNHFTCYWDDIFGCGLWTVGENTSMCSEPLRKKMEDVTP